jgi:hypothetical protein
MPVISRQDPGFLMRDMVGNLRLALIFILVLSLRYKIDLR